MLIKVKGAVPKWGALTGRLIAPDGGKIIPITCSAPIPDWLNPALSWWRCETCCLIHFFCVKCNQKKIIPETWEAVSLPTLTQRSILLEIEGGFLCDLCWLYIQKETQKPRPLTDVPWLLR